MVLLDIRKTDVTGKKVFLRADLDAPLSDNGEIEDDMRLISSTKTITYLLKNNSIVIVGSKLGRPEGKVVTSLSLKPVAKWLAQNFKFQKLGEFDGWKISDQLFLLENLRFHKGEEDNDPEFAQKLASLADMFVNDAFAMVHRSDASVVGITKLLPHYAGIRLQEEVAVLGEIMENPKRPLVVIIGGKKIETKLPLVAKMCQFADYVLVGGKIAQQKTTLEKLTINLAAQKKARATLVIADTTEDKTDITEKSIATFNAIIVKAASIVWNGPVGLLHQGKTSEKGTKKLAQSLAQTTAYKIVGGGDTIEFLRQEGLLNKFDFVSTGGGAMLSFLSGEPLPALEALLA